MKKNIVAACLILLGTWVTYTAQAQYVQTEEDRKKAEKETAKQEDEVPTFNSLGERIYIVGSGGLGFSNTSSRIELSPAVGYKFNEMLSAGIGFTYQRISYKAGTYTNPYTGFTYTIAGNTNYSFYGIRLFGRIKPIERWYGHVELENMNIAAVDRSNNYVRTWSQALFVGAGYNAAISDVLSLNITGLYNLNYSSNKSAYASPFIPRVEIAYNF